MASRPDIQSGSRGFTLIELLMVIVIIAILIAILLPVLTHSRDEAKKKQRRLDQKTLATAILAYKLDTGSWPNPGVPPISYSNDNFLVFENMLASPVNPTKYLDLGGYKKQDGGRALMNPYRQFYCVTFTNNDCYIDGTNVWSL